LERGVRLVQCVLDWGNTRKQRFFE